MSWWSCVARCFSREKQGRHSERSLRSEESRRSWVVNGCRASAAQELERRVRGAWGGPSVHCLRTGERWPYTAPVGAGALASDA